MGSVQSEFEDLSALKEVLNAQSGLRPIFFKEV